MSKRIIKNCLIPAVVLVLALCCLWGCAKREIELDKENSFYSDFRIENGFVYICCHISAKSIISPCNFNFSFIKKQYNIGGKKSQVFSRES